MFATIRSIRTQKIAMHIKMVVVEFEQCKGYTDDWYIHLQGVELKELEAVNAIRHEEVTDDHVKLVVSILPLSEHV